MILRRNSGGTKHADGATRRSRAVSRRLVIESLSQRRVLAALAGSVFDDADASMHRNDGESGLVARVVYLDHNANDQIDTNEPIALTEADGTFRFEDLPDGVYRVGVFNGTTSQAQTTPATAQTTLSVDSLDGGSKLLSTSGSLVQTDSSIVSVDLASGTTTSFPIPGASGGISSSLLPDASVLATQADGSAAAFHVDPVDGSVTPIDLTAGAPAPGGFNAVAVDDSGLGLAIEASDSGLTPVRLIDATNAGVDGAGILVSVTGTNVDPATEIFQSPASTRSLLALPTVDGYSVQLWSNATGSMITPTPIELVSTVSVAAFDDNSGLLAMQSDNGTVKLYDVDDNFSPLDEFDHAGGPVVIDGVRDRLLALDTAAESLNVFNLETRESIAASPLSLASLGNLTDLAIDTADRQVVALGDDGLTRSQLTARQSAIAEITGDSDVLGIDFGLLVEGTNEAPEFDSLPDLVGDEDQPLSQGTPGLLAGATDLEGDTLIVIQRSSASVGDAVVGPDGSLTYTPDPNVNGSDSFQVLLHDGQSASAETEVVVTITSVPDSPTGINLNLTPLAENAAAGTAFGVIEIIDADGDNHTVTVDDDRFEVVGNQVRVAADAAEGSLNYEAEPTIPILITATDNETSHSISQSVSISVSDANDPITGIVPVNASVRENLVGELVAELEVLDEDAEQFHFLTVDDDRFVVDDFDLRLAPGVSLDREATPTITVNVTAVEFNGDNSFTQAITITVLDQPEQPAGMALTGSSVVELVPGAVVGDVLLDNATPDARFQLTTDDSRFEVVGGQLNLQDGVFVERSESSTTQVTITATDTQAQFVSISETFAIDVLANDYPAHNIDNPFDVDHGGTVTPIDALTIINFIRANGPGPVGPEGSLSQCYDVNGDGVITVLDALLVINQVNRLRRTPVTGSGEGEEGGGGSGGGGEGESQPIDNQPSGNAASEHRSIALDDSIGEILGTEASKLVSTDAEENDSPAERSSPTPSEVDESFTDESDWRLS